MSASKINLNIEQGIPFEQEFLVKDEVGSLKDLLGYTAKMQFRTSPSGSISYFSASSTDGNILIIAETSIVKIDLTSADTLSLDYAKYYYDLVIYDSSNKPLKIIEGVVNVAPLITR